MANKQYIGARYVPIFFEYNGSNEWIQGLSYEPLTIVTYMGNSFTSKKTVPSSVGAPNDNPNYWVNTGNFNSQINGIQSEINSLKEDVTDINSEINSLKEDVTDINSEINLLNDKVLDIDKKKGTYAIYFGNSYMVGTGSANNLGVYELTKHLFDRSEMYNQGTISGIGFMTYTTHSETFATKLEAKSNSMSASDRESVSDIIILSAIGDTRVIRNNSADTFENAISNFIDLVNLRFPNAKISIALCDTTLLQNNGDVFARDQFKLDAIYRNSKLDFNYLGWIGWESHLSAGYNSADGYHPNDNGYASLAKNFINSYKYGYKEITKYREVDTYLGTICIKQSPSFFHGTFLKNNSKTGTLADGTTLVDFTNLNVGVCPVAFKNFFKNIRVFDSSYNSYPILINLNMTSQNVTTLNLNIIKSDTTIKSGYCIEGDIYYDNRAVE